jgi:YD repeat-containing protein
VDYPATIDSGPTKHVTVYDGLGRRVPETDEAGVSTGYQYDFRGRLTAVTLDAGGAQSATTVYTYNEVGNQTSQSDALGRTTTFRYDALSRRTQRTLPDGHSESTAYAMVPEIAGSATNVLQTSVTDFRGNTIVTTLDRMDRIRTKVLPAVNAGEVPTTDNYVYSGTGLLLRVDTFGNTARTQYYAHDDLSRLVRKDTPEGVLAYGYGGNGDLS